jgi:hypothetical protein
LSNVVLLAFLSIVNGRADRFGRRGDQRVKRTNFCAANEGSFAARFKCKVYDLTAKLFCI